MVGGLQVFVGPAQVIKFDHLCEPESLRVTGKQPRRLVCREGQLRGGRSLLLGGRVCLEPRWLLAHTSEVVVDDGFPMPVALRSQFVHQLLDVALTSGPPLLQIGFVGVQFAPFARPDNFGKAGSVEVAPNGVAMQPHQGRDRHLTCALLMESDHFVIATFAPCTPALALSFGYRERLRYGRWRNRNSRSFRRWRC